MNMIGPDIYETVKKGELARWRKSKSGNHSAALRDVLPDDCVCWAATAWYHEPPLRPAFEPLPPWGEQVVERTAWQTEKRYWFRSPLEGVALSMLLSYAEAYRNDKNKKVTLRAALRYFLEDPARMQGYLALRRLK